MIERLSFDSMSYNGPNSWTIINMDYLICWMIVWSDRGLRANDFGPDEENITVQKNVNQKIVEILYIQQFYLEFEVMRYKTQRLTKEYWLAT